MNAIVFAIVSLMAAGWENIDPAREFPGPAENIWTAPLERGNESIEVDWRNGATGEVKVVKAKGRAFLRIAKKNDVGYVLVKAKEPFAVPAGSRLRAYAACESRNADCEFSYGFLRLFADREDLTYRSKLDTQGDGGPKMTRIANTPPNTPDRKLSSYEVTAEDGTNVFAAIVVAGAPSTSVWSRWGVENLQTANRKWHERVRNRKPPKSNSRPNDLPDDRFDAMIASGTDHTAKVERRDGYAKFIMDGRVATPVFFKGSVSRELNGFYGGQKMAQMGMDLQSTSIRLGVTKGQCEGYWSKDGFDVKGAVGAIRKAIRMAPKAKYLLSLALDAYPEFADEHPDEVWVNNEGRKVFGHQVHSAYWLPKTMDPKRHWYWMSNHSEVWREAVKKVLTELIDELKRTGLSKAIVGVHLGGYHDMQFATVHPDYSKPAIAAFRKWLRTKYPTEDALRAAWLDGKVTYDTATPPVLHDNFGVHDYFVPGKDQPIIDFCAFLKKGPFFALEDISRHVKRCFGKDIVTVRYCMGAFGGTYCSAYDITPFAESDTIDILCAQPNYGTRVPALACGLRLPVESFHRHGKLFLNEFDLRTYGAMTSWEGELAAIQFGLTPDDASFRSTDRKLAGQMFAHRMGWWYLDMAGGWFEPDAIAADIRDVLAVGRTLETVKPDGWKREVAVVVDEDGALLRNTMAHYYNPDEQVVMHMAYESSGVPYDHWLMADFLDDPKLADGYRFVVFLGMYDLDDRRYAIVKRLLDRGATVACLAGTGVSRGVEKLGLELGFHKFPAQHETRAEEGVDWNMCSSLHESKYTRSLGVTTGWPWQLNSPVRYFVKEAPDVKVMSRFTEDETAAAVEASRGKGKLVYVAEAGGFTPQYFHRLAVESGAYVPCGREGLQIEMNGDFATIHCLKPGEYGFRPPRRCEVINLKTGLPEKLEAGEIRMKLTAGETRWYSFFTGGAEILRTEASALEGKTPIDAVVELAGRIDETRKRKCMARILLMPVPTAGLEGERLEKARLVNSAMRCYSKAWNITCLEAEDIPEKPRSLEPAARFCEYAQHLGGNNWWGRRVRRNREEIAASGGKFDLVMLGDSITHYWERESPKFGSNVLARIRSEHTVLDCGDAGDTTANLLWRVKGGELDGYEAKVITIMIGTNNSAYGYPAEDTAKGIAEILKIVKAKQPKAKIVLMPIFPRGRKDDAIRAVNDRVNAMIRPLADGRDVVWLDFTAKLVDANGDVPYELAADRLHPTEKGYEIWYEALKGHLKK